MKCSIEGCPGEYEERKIVHTVRYEGQVIVMRKIVHTVRYEGQVIVIDHVPAEVCSVCGDVLLKPETVRRIEALLQTATHPVSMVPLYEYA
jgi:YgiT-type zinc finger domain-containing protein